MSDKKMNFKLDEDDEPEVLITLTKDEYMDVMVQANGVDILCITRDGEIYRCTIPTSKLAKFELDGKNKVKLNECAFP